MDPLDDDEYALLAGAHAQDQAEEDAADADAHREPREDDDELDDFEASERAREEDEINAANERALAGGYCTAANAWDIKCGDDAVYLLVAGPDEDAHLPKVREPLCHDHLADEIEQALAAGWNHVEVSLWKANVR